MLEPVSGRFLDLNESATELWDHMGDSVRWTVESGVDYLVASHGLPLEAAREIVRKFLRDLEDNSVIVRVT